MYYLTFVFENGDDVSFACDHITRLAVDGADYSDGMCLSYLSGTIEKTGNEDHYEFGMYGMPRSSFLWLVSHRDDIAQVIVEDSEDFCDTYYVPEGMSFSYGVVNGDLSFEME